MQMPTRGRGQLAGGGAVAVELVAVKIKRRFYAFVFVSGFFIDSQPRRRNVSHATPNSKSKIEKVHSKATKRERGGREQCCTGAWSTTIVSSGNPGLAICHAISHAYQQHSQNLIENGNVLNLSPLAQLATRSSRSSPRCNAAAQRMHLQPSQISCQCWLGVASSRRDTLAHFEGNCCDVRCHIEVTSAS